MIIRMGILTKWENLSIDEFGEYWENTHGSIVKKHLPNLKKYIQNHITNDQQLGIQYKRSAHVIHGFSQLWFESEEAMNASFNEDLVNILNEDEQKFINQLSLFTVEPHVIVPVQKSDKPLIKRMSILKRKEGIDDAAFKHEWKEIHSEYLKQFPNLKGYVQNHIVDRSIKRESPNLVEMDIDGVVEMWFEDIESLEQDFQSEIGQKTMQHAQTFISEISTYLVKPYEIVNGRETMK